jgi:bacterioferritin-associated ferredoxin
MAMVCLCHGVSERTVRKAIERGAGTIEQVGEVCRAGTCCHGCHATIDAMLADAQATDRPVRITLAPAR